MKCNICGREFTRRFNLYRHQRTVHRTAPAVTSHQMMDCSEKPSQVFPYALPEVGSDIVFKHPFTMKLVGSSGSGKTTLMKFILENADTYIRPRPREIYFFYKRIQPMYTEMMETVPGIKFIEGLPPTSFNFPDYDTPRLIIIDDQMTSVLDSKQVAELYFEGSHHMSVSVCILLQNLFHGGKMGRTISLNCSYLILFKNPRDKLQITTLGRQMYPTNWRSFVNTYEKVTSQPYTYLIVDLKQDTPESQRLKGNLKNPITQEVVTNKTDTAETQAVTVSNTEAVSNRSDSVITRQMETLPTCKICGVVFLKTEDRDLHEEQCGKVTTSEIIWEKMYNSVKEEDRPLKAFKTLYANSLVRYYHFLQSRHHQSMLQEFLDKIKDGLDPVRAAKNTVKRNTQMISKIFENFESEETEGSDVDSEESL